ncbi:MAG TPA: HdeD family acid-resistance protein [Nocardioides sp.]|nr:HdeD family acid-resistance protein [Nocardioides sp.]
MVSDEATAASRSARDALARSWALVLGVGVVTFLLGVTLAVWPRETAKVLAILLGLQLVVSGIAQIGMALSSSGEKAGRWLLAISGAVALVVGALLLFSPRQTLTFVALTVGICVMVTGAADMLDALLSGRARRRWWHVLRGALTFVFGVLLVANPDVSLALLALIACVWLICYGFLTVVAALLLRTEHERAHDTGVEGGPLPPRATR